MECWKFARYHRPLIVVIVKNEYLCVVSRHADEMAALGNILDDRS